MRFEAKLKEIVKSFGKLVEDAGVDYEDRATQLIRETLQAKEVRYTKSNCKAIIPAPGLLTRTGLRGIFREDFVSYEGRNCEEALSSEENGFVEVLLMYKIAAFTPEGPIGKVALDFNPKLPLPEKGIYDPIRDMYKYESEKTVLLAPHLHDSGKAIYKVKDGMDMYCLELSIALDNKSVKSIAFPTCVLGKGILTSFFEDFNYTGLDKLIENK